MVTPFRIGLAGLGTVGVQVARVLVDDAKHISAQAGRDIVLSAYSVRDVNKARAIDLNGVAYEADPVALAARDDVDVVVEVMGGADGAPYEAAVAALSHGKHLVTANKAMLAKHWKELFELSTQNHGAIMFEASVGGGMPVVKVLREGLAGNRISRIYGILNGTCNYILSEMQNGVSFDDALREAQALGFAEADASLDVDGYDTAYKLLILARLAFSPDLKFEDIDLTSLRGVRVNDGAIVRYTALAQREGDGKITMRVAPEIVASTHAFANVGGVLNAVQIDAQPVGSVHLMAEGAGGGPTASAVLADIIDLARFDIVFEGPLYLRGE